MNTSELLIIILGFWVFILHSKIKGLEDIVDGLGFAQKPVHTKPKKMEVAPLVTKEPIDFNVTEEIKEVIRKKIIIPKEPSKIMTFITNYFTEGNLLVRIGGVILFFGLAFLLKYAAQHSIISIEIRLWAVAITAMVLIVLGWRLREREDAYGQVLQGLGVAMLYLVIYGAAKFYSMLSLDIAFMLMLGVVLLGSVLAVIEDSLPLALFATAGGFLVPILTSSGDGSHVILFSYYSFLNVGVFILAWYRSWRVLNVLGFLFTFVISSAWGAMQYRTEYFSTTEPFLILYFLMYLFISIIFTIKHPYEPKNLVDGTLVFALPVVAFPLHLHLLEHIDYADAASAIGLGVLYLALWTWLKKKERTELLAQSFLALSIVFFTIAVPYIFDADVSAALWSLEASAIIWIALKQKRKITRYFGILLLTISLFLYPYDVGRYSLTIAEYLGYLIIIIAAFVSSYLLDMHKHILPCFDRIVAKVFIALGIYWWFVSSLGMLHNYWQSYIQGQDILLVLIIGLVLLLTVARFTRWKMLIYLFQFVLPFEIFIFLAFRENHQLFFHPFADWGAALLTMFFFIQYAMLYLYKKEWYYAKVLHLLTLWFLVFVIAMEIYYHVELNAYKELSFAFLPLVLAPLLASFIVLLPRQYKGWLEAYRNTYQSIGAAVLIAVLLFWEFYAFTHSTQSYFPVFNALNMTQIGVMFIAWFWIYRNKESLSSSTRAISYFALGLLGIVLVSIIFARAVHAYQYVPYTMQALWHSEYFQTGLSLLWSSIAIALMLLSKRYSNRILWLVGFGLLIIVVLKLFFVELANSGTVERIISFIVVGLLLLIIGYFVPLAPKKK